MKIWLEPNGWTSNSSEYPKFEMSKDGIYKFEHVPSGVYLVYFDGQKGSGREVRVCNCNEKDEPTQANLLYQQNMLSTGYEIKLDYKYNYQGETFNVKTTWGNVVMAFGDENTIPQKYSLFKKPNRDSLNNPIDTVGKILQPPFVIIDAPYYSTLGDNYRYCNDIFREGPVPPIDFSYTKSGEIFSQIEANPDFAKDGLYNEFQAVEYKNNVVLPLGEHVTKGIYFTWQFAFNNEKDHIWPFLSMSASECYQWIQDEGGTSSIFGSGAVDARVPDEVIEQIKRGENFEFRVTDEAVTYTLSGKVADKTEPTKLTQPLLFKDSKLSVSIYPNPTTDNITLSIEGVDQLPIQGIYYQLFDINGKLIKSDKISNHQTTIKIGSLEAANYFVKVMQENNEIKTFKIQKN
jgi:hypothetical protein